MNVIDAADGTELFKNTISMNTGGFRHFRSAARRGTSDIRKTYVGRKEDSDELLWVSLSRRMQRRIR
jgi:hypothetical protein